MIFNPNDFHTLLPLPATEKWKDGVWDVQAFKHGSMSLIYFAPEGTDYQTPHSQDEWYFVLEGSGTIEIEGKPHSFSPGSAIFVAAGQKHKFIGELVGIKIWAVFYGPKGGEAGMSQTKSSGSYVQSKSAAVLQQRRLQR